MQLGLRREAIANYNREWIINIENISDLVLEQRKYLDHPDYQNLVVHIEQIYPVQDQTIAHNLGITN